MRSLHINKFWYRRGGADIYAIDLATAIIARGEDVHVLSTRHPSNPAHADDWAWPRYYELAGGGQRLRWSELLHALPRVFYNWDASRAVRLLMDRHHFHLAHVHPPPFWLCGSVAYRSLQPYTTTGLSARHTFFSTEMAPDARGNVSSTEPRAVCSTVASEAAVGRASSEPPSLLCTGSFNGSSA